MLQDSHFVIKRHWLRCQEDAGNGEVQMQYNNQVPSARASVNVAPFPTACVEQR